MKASEMSGLWTSPQAVYSWVGKREYLMVYFTMDPNTPTPSYKWKIGDTSIVKLGDDGWFHSLKVGETTVTAITDDGQYQAEVKYRVEDGSNITITGFTFYDENGSNRRIESYTIGYGESVTLGARSYSKQDNDIKNRDIEINHGGVTWSSSDPEIATVVPNDFPDARAFWRGKVTAGTKSGTAMIRVTSVTCPDVYSEFPINVQPSVKHIKSLKVNPSKVEIVIGQEYPIETIINPSDATDKKLFWTTSIGSCFGVYKDGTVVRGLKKGSDNATVKSQDGGVEAQINVVVRDGVIPLSELKLSTYSMQVQMDTAKETHYPSVTVYVPTKAGQNPEDVGINVDIKDPEVLKIREIKVISEKSNRRAVVFKGGKPGYTTVKISSKTDPSQFAVLEVMVIEKISDVYLPYTIHTVPDEIEVERGQIFTIWAKGFGGKHYRNTKSTDRTSYDIYNITWDGNWIFTPNSSQLEVVRRLGDTSQSYVWVRAGYIPGDYEITVQRYPGGVLQEEYGSKTVKVKIVDKVFDEPIGELIPKTYYLCFMDKDEATQADLNCGRIGNPYSFYLGWIKNASTDEKATKFKDSEYDNIGWKIARDGIISKIERSGSYLKLYRGPNYGITQVIFYLKSNPHVYYPCFVEYNGGDWRYYTTDKNVSIETSSSSYTSSTTLTDADISNGRTQSMPATQGTVLPSSSSSSSEGAVVVTEAGTYRVSSYNSKYNYKSDTGLIENKPIETKNTKKISKGSFVDPDSKRGKNGSSLI